MEPRTTHTAKWSHEIDRIDDFLLHLLLRRLFYARLMGESKREKGEEIEDADRETYILRRLSYSCPQLSYSDVEMLWEHVFRLSKREQLRAYSSSNANV